jgi:hypothetical protein
MLKGIRGGSERRDVQCKIYDVRLVQNKKSRDSSALYFIIYCISIFPAGFALLRYSLQILPVPLRSIKHCLVRHTRC